MFYLAIIRYIIIQYLNAGDRVSNVKEMIHVYVSINDH